MPALSAALALLGLSLSGANAADAAGASTNKSTASLTVLGVRGDRFTLNGEPTFLLGFSYYGALGAPEDSMRRDLDDARRHHFNWLRVWATWGAFDHDVSAVGADGRAREPFFSKLRWLVAECDRRSLVVDVTLTRGKGTAAGCVPDFESHKRAVETLVTALKSHRNWYLDLANERDVRDDRFVPAADLKSLRELVRRLDPTRLVTASFGGHDLSESDVHEALWVVGVDFLSPHRPRTARSPSQTEAMTRVCLDMAKRLGRVVPVHHQEPFRRGYGDWEPVANDFLTDLRGAVAGGAAGWCFHNGTQRNAPGQEPRRSFDLRAKRLFDQLDAEELKVVDQAATQLRSIPSPPRPSPASHPASADTLVHDAAEFREAATQARPGTRILLAPGTYPGGFHFANLRGEPNRPVIIAAADADQPPVIQGGAGGLQLSKPAFVELHDLIIRDMSGNGLNIDDAGSFDSPARHVVLRGLKVSNVGPQGNHDAVKLSGVVDFRVEGCVIERWGTGGGSGIDMVGCHRGLIESNLFRHTDTRGSTGVQAKGGTSQIIIRRNRFENAGGRAVNLGGSTGLQFFRPPLKPGEPHSEAKEIRVEGNTFIGGGAAVAFVGVDGARVRFNTIYHPKRWALRILQETRSADFVPSRRGVFTDNLVAFHSRDWAEGGVNIGSGTAPDTFTFARNWWYCLDDPARSRPDLPAAEAEGVYGMAPLFRDVPQGDVRLQPGSPASRVGAEALSE